MECETTSCVSSWEKVLFLSARIRREGTRKEKEVDEVEDEDKNEGEGDEEV